MDCFGYGDIYDRIGAWRTPFKDGGMTMIFRPADQMEGQNLADGWTVVEKMNSDPNSTGGNFSVCYKVKNTNGRVAFLKALDYSRAFRDADPARALQSMTSAYNFERDVLDACKRKRLSKVVLSITSGSHKMPDSLPVDYLIFELANGDARKYIQVSGGFDTAWAFRSLHHVATGLSQLHGNGIAHQDIKPSNVLVFDTEGSKIADFGRSAMQGLNPPHENFQIAGDPAYAPIELMYLNVPSDWCYRRIGCDLYLLGSLAMFFFSSVNMTAAIINELCPEHLPGVWRGRYEDVLPYLRNAYNIVLENFKLALSADVDKEIVEIVRQLCDPDPLRRGHPENAVRISDPLSLERYISRLNILARKAEMGILEVD